MKTAKNTFLNIVILKLPGVTGNNDVNDGVAKFNDCDYFAECHDFQNVLLLILQILKISLFWIDC